MKTLKEITGLEIHKEYKRQQKEYFSIEDDKHFLECQNKWLEKLRECKKNNAELPLSLNKVNYLGKKTRALLKVLEIKEPKTLKELLNLIK